ncbi:MAG: response regulator transcription factor [Acidimicrobiia bacterium]|nr:response regulator transcription factor [Acidimicrobiia bacterium]MDX2465690.1 response regulator transcription factor [Acidimicrobiia bacterium]
MSDTRGAEDPIRVLIADDHPVVRDGLRGLFVNDPAFEVVGEAANGQEAVARTKAFHPDVVLMDLRMPVQDGVSATKEIMDRELGAQVLILTTFDTESDVLHAIEAGAIGYLLKDTPREELSQAVRAAAAGESVLSPPVARQLMGGIRRPARDTLSERELEILSIVAHGATNKAVAAQLFISEATVKTHLLHIYSKLEVNDRAAAVAAGYERGLLTPGDAER